MAVDACFSDLRNAVSLLNSLVACTFLFQDAVSPLTGSLLFWVSELSGTFSAFFTVSASPFHGALGNMQIL